MNKNGVTESFWRGVGDTTYRRIHLRQGYGGQVGVSPYPPSPRLWQTGPRDIAHTPVRRHADTPTRRHANNGSALLLVLFTIMLLTGLITGTVEFLKNDVDEYGARNKEFRARQLAQSGLAYGSVPLVQNEDRGLLEQRMNDGGAFRVVISSESTKLNINTLLQTNRDDILEKLFTNWGVDPKPAKLAVEGLRQYLSGPISPEQAQQQQMEQLAQLSQAQQSGQEGQQQQQQLLQLGKQFQAVEEMSLVPEFKPIMEKQPDWANAFTIWGDGKIDVNLAEADTIALVTGVSPAQASQFVKYRWGPDGNPNTLDDRVYHTMDEVRAGLGMSQQQFQLVQGLLSLNSAVDRIESTGIIAGYHRTIVAIANRAATPLHYLSWEER
jgi:general secretion pathway protein K